MGWSGPKDFIWGDEPQDIIDAALRKEVKDPDALSPALKYQTEDLLLSNKSLRSKVDATYKKEWGRNANNREFRNLIRVALDMGGYTVMDPSPMEPAANPLVKKSTKKSTKRSTRIAPKGFGGMR
jgi:hypothetical protein